MSVIAFRYSCYNKKVFKTSSAFPFYENETNTLNCCSAADDSAPCQKSMLSQFLGIITDKQLWLRTQPLVRGNTSLHKDGRGEKDFTDGRHKLLPIEEGHHAAVSFAGLFIFIGTCSGWQHRMSLCVRHTRDLKLSSKLDWMK